MSPGKSGKFLENKPKVKEITRESKNNLNFVASILDFFIDNYLMTSQKIKKLIRYKTCIKRNIGTKLKFG